MDKVVADTQGALSCVESGMTVAVGGFGGAGFPEALVDRLTDLELHDLVLVSNNAARFEPLMASGAVSKIICSFPFGGASPTFRGVLEDQKVEIELFPQGTLTEKLRAAGSGLGGVLLQVGTGTEFERGRDVIDVAGEGYLLEPPLPVDVALILAQDADRWGNLRMRGTARNFNVVMAMAARTRVAQTERVVPLGGIDPECCDLPGIFVDRVVRRSSIEREESTDAVDA